VFTHDEDPAVQKTAGRHLINATAADHADKQGNIAKYDIACLDICGTKDAFYKTNVMSINIIHQSNPATPAKLISLQNVGHIAWKFAYNNTWKIKNGMTIYEWMLKRKRKN